MTVVAWGVSGLEGVFWKSSQGTSASSVRAGSDGSISSKNLGGEENTFSFGWVAVLANVYFEAKAHKVTVY